MGKLFSAPKAPTLPSLPPIVDTSTPVTTTTPDQQRMQDILTRNRGRVGTITTSFNGVLSNSDSSNLPARKTLLGE
jgi:hypothetical protein